MNEELRKMLIRQEGNRLKPYADTVGKMTIGVGRNLTDVGISEIESFILLDNDIRKAENDLYSTLPWTYGLDEARKVVLLNMTFNMGISGLLKFKNLLIAVQLGSWEKASDEMLDSLWAKQVGKRAAELSNIMLTGVINVV